MHSKIFYITCFGAFGVLSRYYIGIGIHKLIPSFFPYGTFFINITGSFLMGILYTLGTERTLIPLEITTGITVGFLGGYTTFSSYCIEAIHLMEKKEPFFAFIYFFTSPLLACIAAFLGIKLTRFFLL